MTHVLTRVVTTFTANTNRVFQMMKDIQTGLPEASRRLFLQKSLLLLGATAAAPLSALSGGGQPDTDELKLAALSPDDYRILDALTDAIIPHGGAFETGARDIDLARRIDGFLALEKPDVIVGAKGALQYVEHTALSLINLDGRFSGLSFADRTRVLEAMREADGLAVQVVGGLQTLSMFYFYSHESVWPNIGYEGPWVK